VGRSFSKKTEKKHGHARGEKKENGGLWADRNGGRALGEWEQEKLPSQQNAFDAKRKVNG